MAYIGWLAILLCIVGYILFQLSLGILEVCSNIISAIKEKFNKKTSHASNSHENLINERSRPAIEKRQRPAQYGLHGKCEICGQDFSPVLSASENHLNEVAIDFYGKRRIRKLCNKCSQLMLEDKNCKIKK